MANGLNLVLIPIHANVSAQAHCPAHARGRPGISRVFPGALKVPLIFSYTETKWRKATRMIGLRALQATIVVLYLLSDTCAKSVCSDKEDFHLVQFKVPGENEVRPGQKLIFVCDGPSNRVMDVIDIDTKGSVNHANNSVYLPQGCEISESTSPCYMIVSMSANETDGNSYQCRSTNRSDITDKEYSEIRNLTGE